MAKIGKRWIQDIGDTAVDASVIPIGGNSNRNVQSQLTEIKRIEFHPDLFNFDDTDTQVDTGAAFGILKCFDFNPSGNGSIWLNFEYPSIFETDRNVTFKMVYSLDGVDPGKDIKIKTSLWVLNDEQPVGSANLISTDTFSSVTGGNINVRKKDSFSGFKIPSSEVTSANCTITIKFTRDIASGNDTYGGTFKFIKLIAEQI